MLLLPECNKSTSQQRYLDEKSRNNVWCQAHTTPLPDIKPCHSGIIEKGHCVHEQLIEAEWRIYLSVNYAIIGSDNSLSSDRYQAIVWTNVGILIIGTMGTNFNEIVIRIRSRKMCLKMSPEKCRPFCLSLNASKKPGVCRNIANFSSIGLTIKSHRKYFCSYKYFLIDILQPFGRISEPFWAPRLWTSELIWAY